MKKDAAGKETASCCDDGCCKDGSCAMKKDGAASAEHMPENCPMMKNKDGQTSQASMTQATAEHGDSCCCSCCKKAKQEA